MVVGKAPLCNVIIAAAIVAGDGKPTKQNHDCERHASHVDLRMNQIPTATESAYNTSPRLCRGICRGVILAVGYALHGA